MPKSTRKQKFVVHLSFFVCTDSNVLNKWFGLEIYIICLMYLDLQLDFIVLFSALLMYALFHMLNYRKADIQ